MPSRFGWASKIPNLLKQNCIFLVLVLFLLSPRCVELETIKITSSICPDADFTSKKIYLVHFQAFFIALGGTQAGHSLYKHLSGELISGVFGL